MGSSTDKRSNDLRHYVELSDYYISETEVTQELWLAVVGTDSPSRFKGYDLPVENVDWNDCARFMILLNSYFSQYQFNLPTEAQWEFAACGGVSGFKYSGGNDLVNRGWYEGNSGVTTHPVKSLRPNSLGLYDMSGNVAEWCKDFFDDYKEYDQYDPEGPTSGKKNVIRGGAWNSKSSECRTNVRSSQKTKTHTSACGFRIVMKIKK